MPRYYQVASLLRTRVLSGYYPAGSLLGTELGLAERFGVSRVTIRQALDQLSADRLIERRRALGTFVAENIKPNDSFQLEGFLDELVQHADHTGTVFSQLDRVAASRDVANRLGVQPDVNVVRLRRLRSNELGPKAWVESFMRLDVARLFSSEDLRATPILHLFERTTKTRPVSGAETIAARAAEREVAARLNLAEGDPVLYVERVLYSADDKAVEFARISHRWDRLTFNVRLTRVER